MSTCSRAESHSDAAAARAGCRVLRRAVQVKIGICWARMITYASKRSVNPLPARPRHRHQPGPQRDSRCAAPEPHEGLMLEKFKCRQLFARIIDLAVRLTADRTRKTAAFGKLIRMVSWPFTESNSTLLTCQGFEAPTPVGEGRCLSWIERLLQPTKKLNCYPFKIAKSQFWIFSLACFFF